MRRMLAVITVAVLTTCMVGAGWAQPLRWQPIPGAPGVEYVPNWHQDVFRYQERFYRYDGNNWYRGRDHAGPWVNILEPPRVFYQVEERYFRTPPGWDRGKKKGWRGYDLPPGQRKKFNGNIPPGQQKKMGY